MTGGIRWARWMVALGLLIGSALASTAGAAELDELLKKTPAETAAAQQQISAELVKLGAPAVARLCAMLTPPEKGGDVAVRYALHAMATYVGVSGSQAERQMFARAMAQAAQSDAPIVVRQFILEELRLAATPDVIAPVAGLLAVPELCDPAARVLVTIGGEGAAAALRQALPGASGASRVTIVKALGDLRDSGAVATLLKDAASDDAVLRHAAFYALGASGDLAAAAVLSRASMADSRFERSQALKAYLLLVERLIERRQVDAAVRICRELYQRPMAPGEAHVPCAALSYLARALGENAMDDLTLAMEHADAQVRATATELALALPGEAVTRRWIERMQAAPPAARAGILAMLARRGDPLALPAALQAIGDADQGVRRSAIAAAAALGANAAMPALLDIIEKGTDLDRRAARDAIVLIGGTEPDAAIAQRLAGGSPAARAVLLRLLAARSATAHHDAVLAATADESQEVRVAALDALGVLAEGRALPTLIERLNQAGTGAEREAAERAVATSASRAGNPQQVAARLVAAMQSAPAAAQPSYLRVLGRLANAPALAAVRQALGSTDPAMYDAAARVLADWPSADVAGDLLELARNAESPTHHVLALRGYIRLADRSRDRAPVALEMYSNALAAARRVDEKRQVLNSIGELRTMDAMRLAQRYLDDAQLKNEAAVAVSRIAAELRARFPVEAVAALEDVLAKVDNERATQQARQVLASIDQTRGFIVDWQVAGPFAVAGKSGLDLLAVEFAPEKEPAAAQWQRLPQQGIRGGWEIDFGRLPMSGEDRVAYVRTWIFSPARQPAQLEVGSDDGIKVWLNGQVVHSFNSARGNNPGEDKIAVTLNEGWNQLLMKINNGAGGWGANARLRRPDGGRLDGLKYSAEPPERR